MKSTHKGVLQLPHPEPEPFEMTFTLDQYEAETLRQFLRDAELPAGSEWPLRKIRIELLEELRSVFGNRSARTVGRSLST